MTPHPPSPPVIGGARDDRHPGVGLLLAIPAVLTWLITLVLPTGQTILRSFQKRTVIMPVQSRYVGLRNYTDLLDDPQFWRALVLSLMLAIIPIVVAVVIGPSLAAALDRAGGWPRRVGSLVLAVALVAFSPVAIATGWDKGQPRGRAEGGIATIFGTLRGPDTSPFTLSLITGAAIFGALCGLALIVFLPVMRGRAEGRPLAPTLAAVAMITVFAIVAVSLQAYTMVMVMTEGGRSGTLLTLQYRFNFHLLNSGTAAAVATLTGLPLGILGLAATVIVLKSKLRIGITPSGPPPVRTSVPAPQEPARDSRQGPGADMLIGILALVVVVAVALVGSWPWLSGLFSSGPTGPLRPSSARIYANTWIPPLLGAIVSVGTAFLAALGIGGLRPLGRRSELLLLPFAPWLFVGIGPLSAAAFENALHLGMTNRFIGLVPPILLSVPALVVLTLFCRTRSAEWKARVPDGTPAGPAFVRIVVVPALPLAGLLVGATALIGAQGLLWPQLVGYEVGTNTAPLALFGQANTYRVAHPFLGLTTPILVVIVALITLSALQLGYLDRLVIITGRVGDSSGDRPSHPMQPGPRRHWPAPGGGRSRPGVYGPGAPAPRTGGPGPGAGTDRRFGSGHAEPADAPPPADSGPDPEPEPADGRSSGQRSEPSE